MTTQPAKKVEGIQFPKNDKGERSTMDAQVKIWAETFAAINDKQNEGAVLASSKSWRYSYTKYVLRHVEGSLKSPENAIKSAKGGLSALHNMFEFIRDDKTYTLQQAMNQLGKDGFHTAVIQGKGKMPNPPVLEVPYNGQKLSGDSLKRQLKEWARYGTIEQSAADSISNVVDNPQWIDLRNRYFVLLGAGSAMGPYLALMALGANVIAIDINRPPVWERLIRIARESPGRLIFPTSQANVAVDGSDDANLFKVSGSNLMTDTPEIGNWLLNLYPEKEFVVGCYVYLDGEMHVRVALCCDAIMQMLSEKRKTAISLAFLCTPTDAHVIPKEANEAALKQYKQFGPADIFRVLSYFSGNMMQKNAIRPVVADNGEQLYYVDGIVPQQGPNYILAKRMQHWRAIVARNSGRTVSTNIAPSTSTASVVSNKQFAWAYDGMPAFKPMEIFHQETSNAVMTALLINDLNNEKSVAKASVALRNPLELFAFNSFNGGVWRNAYKVGSIGEASVIIHFLKVGKPLIGLVVLLLIGLFLYLRS